ncbi:glycosyl hydrolase 5 family protein-like [Cornus florida]|uniref:glycosyl hydrolase 5 family protein-like n=1 Tax=Cornus florida TaxID=4283 RepID=UPI002898F504|nr:glycosyl hydrolase 5 family protein-like [Cornus florida]
MKLGSSQTSILLSFVFLIFVTLCHSWPLSTSNRWIVDDKTGSRLKLTCVNWPGHVHVMIPEGLQKKPLNQIAANITSMGFNCVRLTYAIYMLTRPDEYGNLTVAQSLEQWNLNNATRDMKIYNPEMLDLKLIDAQKAVVDALHKENIMVVLDNHVSLPQWCCSFDDGNGFFGDKYFHPEEWVQGLTTVAQHYKGHPAVIGMSMRNEIRGPRENEEDWYKHMKEGAEAIHGANPDLLVLVSGLSYDTNLSFVKEKPLDVDLGNKLVYEAHWYSFGDSDDDWKNQPNVMCNTVTDKFQNLSGGFIISGEKPYPLFLSEFGADQGFQNEKDNKYITCLMAYVADKDLDWALWTLQGSYLVREGQIDTDETYGMFDSDWQNLRNPDMQVRLQLIKQTIQDPHSKVPEYNILYHPLSGQCIQVGGGGKLFVSYCNYSTRWSYIGDGGGNGSPIGLFGTSYCLNAVGEGLPVRLSNDCKSERSLWKPVSGSNLHFAAKDGRGKTLCLDWDPDSSSNSTVYTQQCLCMDDDLNDVPNCGDNPQKQWFKLVKSNMK